MKHGSHRCGICGKPTEQRFWLNGTNMRDRFFCCIEHRDEYLATFNAHRKCYLKEAHAILEGKHWRGKNRCVTLLGDQ